MCVVTAALSCFLQALDSRPGRLGGYDATAHRLSSPGARTLPPSPAGGGAAPEPRPGRRDEGVEGGAPGGWRKDSALSREPRGFRFEPRLVPEG